MSCVYIILCIVDFGGIWRGYYIVIQWGSEHQFKNWSGLVAHLSNLVVWAVSALRDEKLPSYVGIIINHYKDPYWTTTTMESKAVFFVAHLAFNIWRWQMLNDPNSCRWHSTSLRSMVFSAAKRAYILIYLCFFRSTEEPPKKHVAGNWTCSLPSFSFLGVLWGSQIFKGWSRL